MKHSFVFLSLVLCTVMTVSVRAAQQAVTDAEVRGELAPLQPEGVRVESVKVEGKRSSVAGVSPSNAVLSEFMRRIDSSAHFDGVELIQIQRASGGIRFDLSMDILCDAAAATCMVPKPGATAAKNGNSVHKCRVDGVLRFQDRPCAAGTQVR
jgi:hypothetical protein